MAQVLRQGCEQGQFRADLDAESAATWLILLIKGTTLHALTHPGAVNFAQVQAEVERWLTP
ncbi:MAG TPA: TetR family transcriptional regulator C-terminal domain-containing protein [Ktedonobacteraceae bacterium]